MQMVHIESALFLYLSKAYKQWLFLMDGDLAVFAQLPVNIGKIGFRVTIEEGAGGRRLGH